MKSNSAKVYKPTQSTKNKNNFEAEKILCNHCKRTKNNGIGCKGICVSDDNY